ncbi:Flp pilus assembly protein, ATPase CpaE [Delftia tsuruhatensis]|uniref:AAA family ATPase n=1 Tax=Delftia tsuruhatensis TaxID=180282 RepID=UPI001E6AC3A7|nr:pilus assembly protein CpaE [Delftia tsuruhatensis]CAB5685091.1 Flp pilus assembly protein, ATPase CpaE [Delftia tsuruhatensis]CAC9690072.1 Flp pilus assembly protein, ATPase CpaE [Delftia tsuruhatensis]
MTSKPTATDSPLESAGSPAIGSPTSLETLLGLRTPVPRAGQMLPAQEAATQDRVSAYAGTDTLRPPPQPLDADLQVELLFIHAGTPESALAQAWMQRMLDGSRLHVARFQDNVSELAQRHMPHAIFVHFDPLSTDEAAQLASQLHISHPHLPCVAVGRTKYPQCMLAALRAGVQDFLDVDAPIQAAQQTVRELIQRMPASQASGPSAPLTAILSARAGLGSSLLASHLAWYLQKRLHGTTQGKEISASEISNETLDGLLIDLGNPGGDCGLYLGTLSDFDFIEAVNNLRRFDRRLASTGLARHDSGLRMLTLPRQPSRLRDVSYADVDALLARMRQYFRHVVADLGAVVPTHLAMRVALRASQVWVVCDQSVASVVSTTELLRQLEEQKIERERLHLIVSRHDSQLELDAQQIARQLKLPLLATIPERRRELAQAVNQGQLLPSRLQREPYVQAVDKLATLLMTSHHQAHAGEQAGAARGLNRFFHRTRS